MAVTGTLKSVDQFLNFRIDNMRVVEGDEARWPHLVSRVVIVMVGKNGSLKLALTLGSGGGQVSIHSWIGNTIRSYPSFGSRHYTTGGRNTQR